MALNDLEGITLSSIPFRENSKIVKVYTNKRGLLSFIANRISRKNLEMISFSSPCTHAEIIYLDKNKDLFNVKEITIKNLYLPLRDSLDKINAAISITKSTLISQAEDKQNIVLFNLISKYLQKLSHTLAPHSYVSSFQLKLLKLEGLIHITDKCSVCGGLASYILKGDFFCDRHARYDGIQFDAQELKSLIFLAEAKKFSEIETIKIAPHLRQKIQRLFECIFN